MRKQYDYYETRPFKYNIDLYHDGIKVATEISWDSDILIRLRELGHKGYTRGYLKEDVEEAHREYEHRYENRIERD